MTSTEFSGIIDRTTISAGSKMRVLNIVCARSNYQTLLVRPFDNIDDIIDFLQNKLLQQETNLPKAEVERIKSLLEFDASNIECEQVAASISKLLPREVDVFELYVSNVA